MACPVMLDVMHFHMLKQMTSPQRCIMRLVHPSLCIKISKNVSEFELAAHMRLNIKNLVLPVYWWNHEEIQTEYECDILLSHVLFCEEEKMAYVGLDIKQLRHDYWWTRKQNEFDKLLGALGRKPNDVIFKWIENKQLIYRCRGSITKWNQFACMEVLAARGEYDRLVTWLEESESVSLQTRRLNRTQLEDVFGAFLKSKASSEEKRALIKPYVWGCNCDNKDPNHAQNMFIWKPILECNDIDMIEKATRHTCASLNTHIKQTYIWGCNFVPATIEIMDWMTRQVGMSHIEYTHWSCAAQQGRIDILQHMNEMRAVHSLWFPISYDSVEDALRYGHIECAEYLLGMDNIIVVAKTMTRAIFCGRLSTVQMVEAKGISLEGFPIDNLVNWFKRDRQKEHIEVIDYVMAKGAEIAYNYMIVQATYSMCEEIVVHLYKKSLPLLALQKSHMGLWQRQDIKFNEYIRKHAGIEFQWGPIHDSSLHGEYIPYTYYCERTSYDV